MINDAISAKPIAIEDPPQPTPGLLGPAIAALDGYVDVLAFIDSFLSQNEDAVTRSGLYVLMAQIIEDAVGCGAEWTVSSTSSWVATAQAYRTRAAEIGPEIATIIEPLGPSRYGAGEYACNNLSLMLRYFVGRAESYANDHDVAEDGSPLTVAECIRVCHGVFKWMSKADIVPWDDGSAFAVVEQELKNQYIAMGDGIFGPIHIPGGSVPWSWAG